MNFNRIYGIIISLTFLAWTLIFVLSPQPKYQAINNITIPKLFQSDVIIVDSPNIKLMEVKDIELEVDTNDKIPSAKDQVTGLDLNFYVYKIGAFGAQVTVSNLVEAYNNAGFPAFTQKNKTNKNLTNILVGPFASEGDIKANQELLNQIAGIQAGEVLTWNP